jgi:hypothetical protein
VASEGSLVQQLRHKFDFWNNYAGAYGPEGQRLDDRLIDFPQVVEAIIDLLRVISGALDHGESLEPYLSKVQALTQPGTAMNDHVASVDSSGSYKQDLAQDIGRYQSMEEIYASVDQKFWGDMIVALNELMKLTAMIRKSSSSNRAHREDPRDPEGEDAFFEYCLPILMRRKFPAARTSLTRLLADSVIARRKNLSRQRTREEIRLSLRTNSQAMVRSPVRGDIDIDDRTNSALGLEVVRISQNPSPLTAISKPDPSILYRFRNNVKPAESIIGQGRSSVEQAMYPPQPKPDAENSGPTKCPYCFGPLDVPLPDDTWK